jgi:transcriptional regulator with XRE-family HTH domain
VPTKIEPFYPDLGSRIQKIREQRNMTQAQLGRSLDPPSTRASIANIESGKQRVLAHTLVQLAAVLDVGIQELLILPGTRSPVPQPKDIERELKRKLNLRPQQLKRLAAATHLSAAAPERKG